MAIHDAAADRPQSPARLRRRRKKAIATIAMFAAMVLAVPATAQDGGGTGDDWNIVLGMGAIQKPDYPGSDEFDTQPVPFVFAEYRDLFYVHGPMFGFNVLRREHFKLGVVARYQIYADRAADDNPALYGLEDIDAGVDAGLSARYENGPWAGELSVFQDVSDTHDGTLAEFELDREFEIGERLHAEFAATATWADDKYMQTYFGITPAQSLASGHREFLASAGLKSIGVSLGLNYSMGGHWVLRSRLEWERLLGDAKDSPLVKDVGSANQPRIGVFLGYRF